MLKNIKWLFFDLGSTLIDESECAEYRIRELLKQSNSPSREVLERRMKEYSSQNRLPYKDTAKEFGLETIKWPHHLEKIYECVPEVLEKLKKKYQLGVIANQSFGTEERLTEYGIRHYFDVIASSAEEGISKPDLRIFEIALAKAKCVPDEACMIGDRLDNDIDPASRLGMSTVWVKQGSFACGNVNLISRKPDLMIERIEDLLLYI
ncbi:MAG: HAD family hydrolase [Ruminiclostridium sp.]|nr:HAD family hydrolase [Ruminiclostridium sp.]